MNSTPVSRAPQRLSRWRWLAALACLLAARSFASGRTMPDPPQLQRAVNFWVRVYTQIDTDSGFLHDQYHLGVIYATLHFAPYSSPRARQRLVERARDRYIAELRRIAAGSAPLTRDEERIKALWGPSATPRRLLEATRDIRFQLGQSNRFKAGLIRSGAWQQDIARTLAKLGLPPELAALPLVESSYNPDAYSKDGAAGLWQFMPSTGRRFMRIDGAIDDRYDPFRATTAAAQLLAYNYRILGTWPLAITAYNHGAAGMRRAVRAVGTTNIATIIREYHTRTFGFASRNFYVSFLAALEVERHARRYFGSLVKLPEERFRLLAMPAYVPIRPLEGVLDVTASRLRELNPALRPAVWEGRLDVPRNYRLRLPRADSRWTTAMLASRLGARQLYAAQPRPPSYRVRAGDTLSRIASLYRVNLPAIERLNGLGARSVLRVGQRIDLPGVASRRLLTAASAARPMPAARARTVVALGTSAGGKASAPVYFPRGAAHPMPIAAAVVLTGSSPSPVSPGPAEASGITHPGAFRVGGPAPRPAQGAEATAHSLAMISPGPASDAAHGGQPVSAAQAEALSPALGPSADTARTADPTDYAVAPNDTIRVAAAETLGHYAEWLDVTAWDLRRLNHMSFRQPVIIGRRLRLDFRRVTPQQFEQLRIAYHRGLETQYFASHRILGTEVYVARRGDSLWTVTRRYAQLPDWLLRQYNPDTDFSDLHPGAQIIVPRIETLPGAG